MSGQTVVAGSCERRPNHEVRCSAEGEKLLDHLSDYQLIKNDSVSLRECKI
jgi:hypothetical protein